MKKILKIDNFILKIIACITMTFDHVGIFLDMYMGSSVATIVQAFRIIGRIAFPIFAFLIVEGALHTKDLKKYILRIGIMAAAISIFLLVFQYSSLFGAITTAPVSNIFLQFLLCLVTIFCLNLKKYWKLFALLPFGYIVFIYISTVIKAPYMSMYPKAFLPDYGLYGFIIVIGTYLLLKYYNNTVSKVLVEEDKIEAYKETTEYKIKYNSFAILPLFIMTGIITLLRYVYPVMNTVNVSLQSYAFLAAIPLFLYSGKLGKSNKIIKYGFYGFYPVHIILIWLIFTLIYL